MLRAITPVVICFFVAIQGFPATAQQAGQSTCEERLDKSAKVLNTDNSTQEAAQISVATAEWPPLTSEAYFAPYMSYGRTADVVISAFRAADRETRLEFVTFDSAYERVLDNQFAGAFPYYKTFKREEEVLFSKALHEVTDVFFYDKLNAPYLKHVTSLPGLRKEIEREGKVAFLDSARFVSGYCYHDTVDRAFQRDCTKSDHRDLNWDLDAFRALVSDPNVLLLPSAKGIGERILQTWFNEDERARIGVIEKPAWQRKLFLVAPCRRESKALIAQFNNGLERIQVNGLRERLETAPLREESVLRTVKLSDPGTFPLVVARTTKDSEETVVLPRGTKAIVHLWSRNFHTPQKTTLQQQLNEMSRVMITNGPQRGQLLWVKNVFIELE